MVSDGGRNSFSRYSQGFKWNTLLRIVGIWTKYNGTMLHCAIELFEWFNKIIFFWETTFIGDFCSTTTPILVVNTVQRMIIGVMIKILDIARWPAVFEISFITFQLTLFVWWAVSGLEYRETHQIWIIKTQWKYIYDLIIMLWIYINKFSKVKRLWNLLHQTNIHKVAQVYKKSRKYILMT